MSKSDVETALRKMRELVEAARGDQPHWPHGADRSRVQDAERLAGIALDEEARALFETMNGSARAQCVIVTTDEMTACGLLSLDDAIGFLPPPTTIPWTTPFHFKGRVVKPDPRVQPCLSHPKWFPIAETNGGSTLVFFDGAPAPAGRLGQIIAYQHDPDAVYWIAPSVSAFLAGSNALLEIHGSSLILGGYDPHAEWREAEHAGPKRMHVCVCAEHSEPPRTIEALWERVTYTPQIKESLELVARNEERALRLFRCVACGRLWQGSNGENPTHGYVQHVPAIDIEAWEQEPFQEAWDVFLYATTRDALFSRLQPGDGICRVAGCGQRTVRFSLECIDHEFAAAHERGALSVPPGRPWPAG